ncbi:MAG: ABC transporter substrate-binding protein [Thermotogota bacterium]
MKKVLLFLTLIFIMLTFVACEPKEVDELTIGILPDVDSIPFIIAKEKGYFEEENVNVNLEYFKSPVNRDSALQSGNLDAAISDVLAAAFAKDNDFEMNITSMTNGSYKLIVNKDAGIDSIQGLKDKEVAMSKNTIIEYATDMMLKEAGMSFDYIEKAIIPQIPTRLEMLQSGKVTAATLPEPLATVAISNGAVFINSSDNLGINPGILLFTKDALEEKEESIKRMYKAYNKAIEYLQQNDKADYVDILISEAGFPPVIESTLILPKYNKAEAVSKNDFNNVIDWLVEKNLIDKEYDYSDIVNNKFVD